MNNQLKVGTKVYIPNKKDDTNYLHATIIGTTNTSYIIIDENGETYEVKHVYTENEYYDYIQDKIISISLQIEELRVERYKACQLLDQISTPLQRKKH